MVAKFEFYLDGTQVTDPKGWDDVTTTFKRNSANHGLLITQEGQLEFFDDGYTYLKNIFDTQGYCSQIEIIIKQRCGANYDTIFNGLIFISDCVFDLMRCSVKVKTVDNSYYAKIDNNKSIKAKLDVARSKNDTTITACPSRDVHFFEPATGTYDVAGNGQPVTCWAVYDVFEYLVAFMSDGTVEFTSDIFGSGGDWEGVVITMGERIRLMENGVEVPTVSFNEVYEEINKKFNIGFSIEYNGSTPVLRIEDADYFFDANNSLTLPNAIGVTMQLDPTQNYAKIHLGMSEEDVLSNCSGCPHFPESVDLFGFKDETFHILGKCNIDTELNLVSSFLISNNTIEDVYIFNNDQYDGSIFIINSEWLIPPYGTNQWYAVQSDWLNYGYYFYNELLTNDNTANRWLSGIPNSILKLTGADNYSFRAERNNNDSGICNSLVTEYPLKFENDFITPNYDTDLVWGNAVTQGTLIPQANCYLTSPSGLAYSVYCEVNIKITNKQPIAFNLGLVGAVKLYLIHTDSSANQIVSYDTTLWINDTPTSETITIKLNKSFNLVNTNRIYAKLELYAIVGNPNNTSFSYTILNSSYISGSAGVGGGRYKEIDPENYKIKKYSFNYPVTYADYLTLRASPTKIIEFTTNNGQSGQGWIDELKYFHHDKAAQIRLITN